MIYPRAHLVCFGFLLIYHRTLLCISRYKSVTVLQCVAVCCSKKKPKTYRMSPRFLLIYHRTLLCIPRYKSVTPHTMRTHCSTLHHTAIHCNTQQHTATHCNTLQHTAPHCNTLQHTHVRTTEQIRHSFLHQGVRASNLKPKQHSS